LETQLALAETMKYLPDRPVAEILTGIETLTKKIYALKTVLKGVE
jgi:hypothetical protein